ncbi:MAG: sigma-70 family RNA polymerase sigma factor [Anaerolineae bacterium]|nr:sigma-70 family RNA polymerase sigma factor [Anaerolineae bacterium]MDW8100423.1 sigma-70 family RNA polymerase sigma factor [Anaerolineae bacterium]
MKTSVMWAGDDAGLFTQAKAFDPAALSAIYDRYESRIYSYIYHRVGDPHVAEDLTAQVFLRVLEAIQNENAWRSSFSGWLYRIAHNLVIDHYRHQARLNHISLDEAPSILAENADPEQAAERQLQGEQLRQAINRLTEEQAQIVSLRFLEGLSITEVAEITGKTEGAVKALQYRAIIALRRLLNHAL